MKPAASQVLFDDGIVVPSGFHGVNRIEIHGSESPADEAKLLGILESCSGRGDVRILNVKYSARLKDCSLAERFPSVEVLHVQSSATKSLRGIEACTRLGKLVLNTGKKSAVDTTLLPKSTLRELFIHGSTKKQLLDIARSQVQVLELVGGESSFAKSLRGGSVSELSVSRSNVETLDGLDAAGIRKLHVANCSRLRGVSAHCELLESLIVESCKAFEPASIELARNLQFLMLTALTNEVRIDQISLPPRLQEVRLTDCSVSTDAWGLPNSVALKKVWVSPFPGNALQDLSKNSQSVAFSNGEVAFRSGVHIPMEEFDATA